MTEAAIAAARRRFATDVATEVALVEVSPSGELLDHLHDAQAPLSWCR